MTKTRAVIVEDEPLARQALRDMLGEIDWLECVGEVGTGSAAVELIDATEPDVVFLDIQLPELDGLEVLRRVQHQPGVVFTTAYDRYAVSAFELEALDYLLKPFGRERLNAALERVRKNLPVADNEPARSRAERALESDRDSPLTRFFVRDQGRLIPINTKDVERLEADDDYVRVYSRGKVYLVYLSLNDFERRLDPSRFVRVHRTHIVNLDFVSQLVPFDGNRMQVEMRGGARILASRARTRVLRDLAL
jgi:two-component system, LytTR family, response regulator